MSGRPAAAAPASQDATFTESFDAAELERTVTQPILKMPSANGATDAPHATSEETEAVFEAEPFAPKPAKRRWAR